VTHVLPPVPHEVVVVPARHVPVELMQPAHVVVWQVVRLQTVFTSPTQVASHDPVQQ
jgi:hypothetical protein